MDTEFESQGMFESINTDKSAATKDAFFRERVSEPFTLFDSFHRYRENDKFSYSFGSSGTKTFYTNQSALDLTISGSNTDFAYTESKKVMPYQPGKSLLIMQTFVFAAAQTNLRQRIGYFSAQNGVYFEQHNNTLYFVLRSYVTGVLEERRIPQSSWNGHKFDGSAFYQRNLDVTKANILWFDIEWLGVGDVRCGFIVDGVHYVAHTFHNDNLNTTTYMTTATLPVRAEIENTGTTTGATLKLICATVASEGGFQALSPMSNVCTSIITSEMKTLDEPGRYFPLVSMKLKSSRLDSVVLPTQVDLLSITNDNFAWKLVLNPGLSTTSFADYNSFSSVQIDTSAASISTSVPGTVLASGILYTKTQNTLGGIDNFNFQLGRSIQGTSDIVTLAVASSGNTGKCIANLSWMELV